MWEQMKLEVLGKLGKLDINRGQKHPDLRRSQSEVNHQTAAQHSPEQASLSHSSKPSRSSAHGSTAYSSSSSAHGSTTHSSRPSGAFGSSGGAKHPSRSSLVHEYGNSNLRDTLLATPWRALDWSKRHKMRKHLRRFQIDTPGVECLRILVHGPVGAGKSSFINAIDSIFQGRLTNTAPVADHKYSKTFTKKLQVVRINNGRHDSFLPFALCDIMGLEEGELEGVLTDDLINVLEGYIIDDYEFNPTKACSETDPEYNSSPSLGDRIHCLVSVIPANTISNAAEAVIDKMRAVREKASMRGIPQLVVLTKVDETSPQVAEDITVVYRSKAIRLKMQQCSNRLGIPLNCVFPVKNYSEEVDRSDEVDVLLLSALKHILNYANDHIEKMAPPCADMRSSTHDQCNQYMDTEDSRMEDGHPANMRRSRLDQYMDKGHRDMGHGHPANEWGSRHDQYTDTGHRSSRHHDVDFRKSERQHSPYPERSANLPRKPARDSFNC